MRTVFMGTPDFAAASLRALLDAGFEVAAAYTQPDKPGSRGVVSASPVKALAQSRNIPVYQPKTLRAQEALKAFLDLNAEALAVVAYGKILPDAFLDAPRYGAVNIHASLLPKYRGAAPIQWAVLNGDRETGVSSMYLASEVDAGDVIYQRAADIGGGFFFGAGLQQAAVHVAAQRHPVAVQGFHLGQAHPALGIQRMQGVRAALHHLLRDGHDIAVGVLDGVKARGAEAVAQAF